MNYLLKAILKFELSGESGGDTDSLKRKEVVGILYNLLRQVDSNIDKLHDNPEPKPYSIFIGKEDKSSTIDLEINLLNSELIKNFLIKLESDKKLNFQLRGKEYFLTRIESIDLKTPYELIKKSKDSLGLVEIKYCSPVILSKNNRLTRLKKLFKNLRQNWNFFYPDVKFKLDLYDDPPYQIRESQIKMFPVDFGYSQINGFIGKEKLFIEDYRLIALLLMGQYSFIGKKTSFGLGRNNVKLDNESK